MTGQVRHLRAFVAVAERGSISRAAVALRLSQPAVSRTLAQLEAHLGLTLVDRSTHHLALTDEGWAFLPRARVALQLVDDALDVRRLHHWPLRLGHTWGALGAATTPLLREWSRRLPDTPLELHRIDERTAGLATGSVDAAVLRGAMDSPGLERQLLGTEARMAAVPVDSTLASRRQVHLGDLCDQPLVLNTVSGTTRVELWPPPERPTRTVEVLNTDDWLAMIASGRGVGVTTTATLQTYANVGVSFVPIADADPVDVWVAWRNPPTHPLVPSLIETAAELFEP